MIRQRKIAILLLVVAFAACAKPTTQPLPETPFTKAARAADDIGGALKLLVAAESNLDQQKLITHQEGLQIIDALAVVQKANAQFINDIEAAKASGSKSAAVPSGKALIRAVAGLTGLTVKNERAKQTFDGIMSGVNLALAVVENFIGQ